MSGHEAGERFARSSRDYGVAGALVGSVSVPPLVAMSFRAPASGSLTSTFAGLASFPSLVSLAMGGWSVRALRGGSPEALVRSLRLASIPAFIVGGMLIGVAVPSVFFDVFRGGPVLTPWVLGGAAGLMHIGVLELVHAERLEGSWAEERTERSDRGRVRVAPAGFGIVGWW